MAFAVSSNANTEGLEHTEALLDVGVLQGGAERILGHLLCRLGHCSVWLFMLALHLFKWFHDAC